MTDNIDNNGGEDKHDPFNLEALREPQNIIQVRRRRLSLPVKRKPNRQDFVRAHPDQAYRVTMPLFKPSRADDDEEMYFVHPSLVADM